MSFFAVLADEQGESDFTVPVCHINLWSLDAIGPRRTLTLDVGIRIKAGDKSVNEVVLALPVGTGDRVEDLAGKVLDTETAALIFDKEVTKPSTGSISYDGTDFPVVRVKTTRSVQDAAYRSKDFAVWTLKLTTTIKPGASGYLRVRFPVTAPGRTWQWQRQYAARVGAIVDFRVCDVRGTATVEGGDELRGRITPIDRIALFLMVPSWLHQRSVSPAPRYVRLLEGSAWAGYLGRAPEIRSRSKLVVYYWTNTEPAKTAAPDTADGEVRPPQEDTGAAAAPAAEHKTAETERPQERQPAPASAEGSSHSSALEGHGPQSVLVAQHDRAPATEPGVSTAVPNGRQPASAAPATTSPAALLNPNPVTEADGSTAVPKGSLPPLAAPSLAPSDRVPATKSTVAPVSQDKPLRVFVDLVKDSTPISPLRLLVQAAFLTAVALLLFDLPLKDGWHDLWERGIDLLGRVPGWLGVSTVAGVVVFLLAKRFEAIKNLILSVRLAMLRAEAALFRKLPK